MNNIENRKALLAQRKERFLQTIHKVGLTTLIGFSGLSANAESSALPSSSPRFFNAPVQAKIVATEFVDVSSPAKCL